MKPTVRVFWGVALALLTLACVLGVFLGVNRRMPTLRSGASLPADLDRRQYVVQGGVWDPAAQGYRFSFDVGADTPDRLALVLTDFTHYTLYINGRMAGSYRDTDTFSRMNRVPFTTEEAQTGTLSLLFTDEDLNSGDGGLVTAGHSTWPKIMLGGEALTERWARMGFGITMCSLGMYLVLVFNSLTLFWGKRSEQYLPMLLAVSAIMLLTTLITAPWPILSISQRLYTAVRPLVVIAPMLFNTAACLMLAGSRLPDRCARFLSTRYLLALVALLLVLQLLIPKNLYNLVQFVLAAPTMALLIMSAARGSRGGFPLILGYSASLAVVIWVYLCNGGNRFAAFPLMMYVRVTQLGFLFCQLMCMMTVNLRFAGKFEESERLNLELDEKVEARTRQLLSEQENRRMLLQNIFHDLRSPLFVMKGCLERLIPANDEGAVFKGTIGQRLDFLQRLIEDLFLISKLDSEAIGFEGDCIALDELAREMTEGVMAANARQPVTFCLAQAEPVMVWGDAMRLQQVLQNLLDNAVAYTPDGGSVEVRVYRQGGKAVLSVRDTGKGIAPEDMPHLFERYYRVNRAINRKSTGLGLYIAKTLVEMHHGVISVDSVPGQGTCMRVELDALETC